MQKFNSYNAFDLSHDIIFTCKMGELKPFDCQEVIPGDIISANADVLTRMMPMLSPLLHRVNVYIHDWFVPKRILWDNYQDFYTGGRDGRNASQHPYIMSPIGGWTVGSTADMLGFPTGVDNLKCDALPFRAVAEIYNTRYRDENLIDPVDIAYTDGLDSTTYTGDYYRAWGHGYFEDALPFMQKGPQVSLPSLSGTVPVVGNGKSLGFAMVYDSSVTPSLSTSFGLVQNGTFGVNAQTGAFNVYKGSSVSGSNIPNDAYGKAFGLVGDGTKSGVVADLNGAGAIPIPEVRQAFQTQLLFEVLASGGSRFEEYLSSIFDVRINTSFIQRPLFLGGGKVPMSIGEVLQTSSTDATSPQGNMAGRGISAQRTRRWRQSFSEPGYIISFINVRPKAVYGQGLPRQFSRWTRFDEYNPIFSHLSMQAILNKEIAAQGSSVVDNDGQVIDELPWGYTPMYNELRHIPSRVAGLIKTSLDFWSLWRKFDIANDGVPGLDEDFINCKPDNRIFADPNTDQIIVQVVQRWKALRRLPKFGTPGLIDHR